MSTFFPRSLLLCFLGLADCTQDCESAQSWTKNALDEDQSINLLQMRGSKSSSRACPIPEFPAFYGYGKGCPVSVVFQGEEGASCLEGNRPYATFHEAWVACGKNPECAAIMQNKDQKYYVRRASDPDLPAGQGFFLSQYDCPELAGERAELEAQLNEEAHERLEDQVRRKQHEEIVKAQIEEMKASYAESEADQKQHAVKAMIHNIQGGGLDQEELDTEIRVLQSMQAELGELFEEAKDTACGWANEKHCQEKNYAFIHNGMREMNKISREHAATVCGEVCHQAGKACGGFMWDTNSSSCMFRKDARCGVYADKGRDCYAKKSPPRPISEIDIPKEQAHSA